jgi:hypothetical protein
MKKTASKLLTTLTILCASACGSNTTYRPSIYGHDYVNREIITPATYARISCGDAEFNKYVSVNLDDLAKLALILKHSKVPKKVRVLIEDFSKEVDLRVKMQGFKRIAP